MRVDAMKILPVEPPSMVPGNGGIVPPWLREPWHIVLPVEPDDDVSLPVLPTPPNGEAQGE